MPYNVLYKFNKVYNNETSKKIKIEGISKQNFGSESVSDITGTAIPLFYAITKFGKNILNKTDIKLTKGNYNQDILKMSNIKKCTLK